MSADLNEQSSSLGFPAGRVDPPDYLNPKSPDHKLFIDAVLSATIAAYHDDILTLIGKMTRDMSGYQGNAVIRTSELYAYIGRNPANTKASLEAFIRAVCDVEHFAVRSPELADDGLPRAIFFREKGAPPMTSDPYAEMVTRVKAVFSDLAAVKKLITDDAKNRASGKPTLSFPDGTSLLAWAREVFSLAPDAVNALLSDLDILPAATVLDEFYFADVNEILSHPSGMVKVMIPRGPIVDTPVEFLFSANPANIEYIAMNVLFPAMTYFIESHMTLSDRQYLNENITQDIRKGTATRVTGTQSAEQLITQMLMHGLSRSPELEIVLVHIMRYAAGQAHSTVLYQLTAFAWLTVTRARAVRRSQEEMDRQSVMEMLMTGSVKREVPASFYQLSYVSVYEHFIRGSTPRYDTAAIKAFFPLTKMISGSSIPQYTEIGDGVVLSPRLIDVFDTLLHEMRAAAFNRIADDWARTRIPGRSQFERQYGNVRAGGEAAGVNRLTPLLNDIDGRFLAVLGKLIDYRATNGDARAFAQNIYTQFTPSEGISGAGTGETERLDQLKEQMLSSVKRSVKNIYADGMMKREAVNESAIGFSSYHEKVEALFDSVVYRSMNPRIIVGRETRPLIDILGIRDHSDLKDTAKRIRRLNGHLSFWGKILQFFRSLFSGISSASREIEVKTRLYAASDKAERERILRTYRGPNRHEMEAIAAEWEEHERSKHLSPASAPVKSPQIKIKNSDALERTRGFLTDTPEKKDLAAYLLKRYYADRMEFRDNTSVQPLIDSMLVSETNNILYLSVSAVKALKEGRQKEVVEYLTARHEALMNFLTQRGISVGEPDLVKRLRPLEPMFRKDIAAERTLARLK
ncbi:MAG: hypothetical protein AABZ39_00440 [Spirochaetota bacterium]